MQNIFREVKTRITFGHRRSLDYSAHLHDDIELIYVKKGVVTAYCDGRRYALTDGSFFLAFPNQIHHYDNSKHGEYILLILKPSRLRYCSNVFLEGQPESAMYLGDPGLAEPLELALQEFEQEGDSWVVDGYLTAFFGKLLRHYPIEKANLTPDCVLSILQYCAQHYRENISIGDIAAHLHISRSHISYIFSHRLRMCFCDYINSLRLQDAVKLLEGKGFSMAEIAGQVGFPTIRTFNRAFLKRYGCSPSEYRRRSMSHLPQMQEKVSAR